MNKAKNVVLTVSQKLDIDMLIIVELRERKADLERALKLDIPLLVEFATADIKRYEDILEALDKENYDLLV